MLRVSFSSVACIACVLSACSSDDDPATGMGAGNDASSPASNGRAGASGAAGSAADGGRRGDSSATGAGSSGGASGAAAELVVYGQVYEGGEFHLGPVDWEETQWHNACASGSKYAPSIRQVEGDLLAGLWGGIADIAGYCDACISVTTARGKSATLRVVTYGDTTPNSIDVGPQAYELLNSGEYPRAMHWQFTKCPETGPVIYEFQAESSQWWTSLWVRNARVPLSKVEVESANHGYVALTRGSDGTLTDAAGFGEGRFSLRLTGVDGQTIVHSFEWPASGLGGALLRGAGNFP